MDTMIELIKYAKEKEKRSLPIATIRIDTAVDFINEKLASNGVSTDVSGSFSSIVKPLTKALEMIMDKINSGAPPSIEKDGEIRHIAQFALDNFR